MRLTLFFTCLTCVARAITVLPSNRSQDLDDLQFVYFHVRGPGPLNGQALAPLTTSLAHLSQSQRQSFNVKGFFKKVVAGDARDLNNSQIACVPCDTEDYPGELTADETVRLVVTAQQPPAAVLLYSTSSSHCNYSADGPSESQYQNVFTFTRPNAADALRRAFGDSQNSSTTNLTMNSVTAGSADGDGDSGGNGQSPNTAMIILYSITGIITALFLGIIITGAVRAHRHPERYGPRRVAGRPRQSRARGIARAMLDTIPIVKFDDNKDQVDAAKRDIEMSLGPEDPAREHSPPRSENAADIAHTTPHESELPTTEHHSDHQPITAAPEAKTDAAPDAGNFSCPICTDDFVKGQDLRVLPCNHQFHPECIDPWLVNVSGTCPLCRIDLNPPKPEENAEQEGENAERTEEAPADGTATPTAAATTDTSQARHSRITGYLHGPLNARRMRNATVEERLAALRHVRETSQGEAAMEEEDGARPNRSRLTTRLRDRFRIRTRAHGETPSPGESGTATPTTATAAPGAW